MTSIRYWGIPSGDRICFMAQLKFVLLMSESRATTSTKIWTLTILHTWIAN